MDGTGSNNRKRNWQQKRHLEPGVHNRRNVRGWQPLGRENRRPESIPSSASYNEQRTRALNSKIQERLQELPRLSKPMLHTRVQPTAQQL